MLAEQNLHSIGKRLQHCQTDKRSAHCSVRGSTRGVLFWREQEGDVTSVRVITVNNNAVGFDDALQVSPSDALKNLESSEIFQSASISISMSM